MLPDCSFTLYKNIALRNLHIFEDQLPYKIS